MFYYRPATARIRKRERQTDRQWKRGIKTGMVRSVVDGNAHTRRLENKAGLEAVDWTRH